MTGVAVRAAVPADAGLIHRFIVELAHYERLAHEVVAEPELVAAALFGPEPRVFASIAAVDGAPAGFALWFYSFSTFHARHGLYLEDLFVAEGFRGHGVGRALLRALAARCRAEGLTRLEWSVLDWNTPAIDFYKAQGAVLMEDWTRCRVSGDALARLSGADT